jgi:hypothetical protein
MFAIEARASALVAGHSTPCRPIPRARRIPVPVISATLRLLAPRYYSALCTEDTYSPLCYQQLTHPFSRIKSPNRLPFNSFRTLPRTGKKLTPCASVTSGLSVHSFAKERKSTPLLSVACGLFRENVGVREKLGSFIDSQLSLLFPERHPADDLAEKPSDTIVALSGALSLTLTPNGVIPLRGSKLTIEEIQCVDLVL